MKKRILILLLTIVSLTTNAQHFGVTLDFGASRLSDIYNNPYMKSENNSKLYYSLGLFYTKISTNSRWGFRSGIEFSKRGYGYSYDGTLYAWSSNSGPDNIGYIEDTFTQSNNSIILIIGPTLNITNKLQLII